MSHPSKAVNVLCMCENYYQQVIASKVASHKSEEFMNIKNSDDFTIVKSHIKKA